GDARPDDRPGRHGTLRESRPVHVRWPRPRRPLTSAPRRVGLARARPEVPSPRHGASAAHGLVLPARPRTEAPRRGVRGTSDPAPDRVAPRPVVCRRVPREAAPSQAAPLSPRPPPCGPALPHAILLAPPTLTVRIFTDLPGGASER